LSSSDPTPSVSHASKVTGLERCSTVPRRTSNDIPTKYSLAPDPRITRQRAQIGGELVAALGEPVKPQNADNVVA
jgi:hypothetical protein